MKEKKSFEEKNKELEEIVSKMDSGNLPLEEMIKCYERAQILIKSLKGDLNNFKNLIEEYNNK